MAVQARVPVVPIVIANYNHLYDSAAKRFQPGNVRIKGKSVCALIIAYIVVLLNHDMIRFFLSLVLPPVDTTNVQEDSESVDALANNVRDMMLTTLKEISIPPPSSLPSSSSSPSSLPSSSDESRKSQ